MILSPKPNVPPFPSSAPAEAAQATLRALTYRPRPVIVPLLTESLEDCGCWVRERSGGANNLVLRFEISLYAVVELYSCLIECGLEFDRCGHRELALLCTLRRHAIVPDALRRMLNVRLELTFADELEPETLRIAAALA